MGIYIKGMEMPTSCSRCVFRHPTLTEYSYCMAGEITIAGINEKKERLDDCPLVSVPPHGRLIDADALETDTEYDQYLDDFVSYTKEQIRLAPTIIEAEEGE